VHVTRSLDLLFFTGDVRRSLAYGARMPQFVVLHAHQARECRTAYAAWSGFDSPLRKQPALASCATGAHRIYWTITADDEQAALAQPPGWLAQRAEIAEVREVGIP
jgi:hypothetical protein